MRRVRESIVKLAGGQTLDTRTRIVAAAADVMRERGLSRATTKLIARTAGVSEGTLYNYFEGKEEIFLAVLGEQLPEFIALIRGFPDRAGKAQVRDHLLELAQAALAFYNQSIPMGASLFSETELLERHRAMLAQRGAGPHRANQAVAEYFRREQDLCRVTNRVAPSAPADMLLGACYQRAYWTQLMGEAPEPEDEVFVQQTVDAVLLLLDHKE